MKRLFLLSLLVTGCVQVGSAPTAPPVVTLAPPPVVVYITPAPQLGTPYTDFLTWATSSATAVSTDWTNMDAAQGVTDTSAGLAWLATHQPLPCYSALYNATLTAWQGNATAFSAMVDSDPDATSLIYTAADEMNTATGLIKATSCP